MTPILNLEHGDLDDLEGRVIIYACSPAPLEEGGDEGVWHVVAMFFTTRPADFVDRFGVPEGGMEELDRQVEEAQENLDSGAVAVVPIYGAQMEISETEIELADDDVVYAGEFLHAQMAQVGVQIAAQLYVLRYSEQILTRSGLIEEAQEQAQADQLSEPEEASDEPLPTYQAVPRDEMADYFQSHYVAPIMLALEEEDMAQASTIARDFIRFCGPRGPITDDAYALAAAVRSFICEKPTPVLYKYFEKILAIANEQFEDAARLRDEIKAMRRGSTES